MGKYVLPIAGENILGGIKVGKDFVISKDGTLNIKDMEEMQERLSSIISNVEAGKEMIAEAISERGIACSKTETFLQMSEKIRLTGCVYASLDAGRTIAPYILLEE